MLQINRVAAGRAISWYQCGWKIFSSNIVTWVLMTLIFLVSVFVLSILPFIGAIALYLLVPVLQAGMIYAAQKIDKGKTIEISDLFLAFKMDSKRNSLLALGGLMLAVMFILAMVSFPIIGGGMMASLDEVPASGEVLLPGFGFGTLLFGIIAGIGLAMLFFYAPALIILRDMKVIEAVKASFSATSKNFLPFVIFMLIYAVLAIVAAIPFALGFLVLLPVIMAANYCSYRDVFV